MARYDYDCPGCGTVELEHSMDADRNEQSCPICGVDVEPLIVGVQLSAGAEFRRYRLENGKLSKVEDHPNFTVEGGKRGIWIESKKQEKAIMEKMGCRFGEKGETLAGGDGSTSKIKIGDKPEKPVHIRR